MEVKEIMYIKLTTVSPNDKLDRVFFCIFENLRHLPVLKKISWSASSQTGTLKSLRPKKTVIEKPKGTTVQLATCRVKNIMRRNFITIEPEQRAANASYIMAKNWSVSLPLPIFLKLL